VTSILADAPTIIGLVILTIGVYGVVAYRVSRRVPEFAVRIALGSSGRDILSTTLAHGLGPVTVGIAIGTVGAWSATRLLSSLLFGVEPTDPTTYAIVAATLIAVATVASWLPARQASRVDPMVVLRDG
jgi:putative ABC transport system permease protein